MCFIKVRLPAQVCFALQHLLGWGWGLLGIWYGMLTWSPGWQFGDMTSGGQQGSVSEMSISFQRTVLFFKTQLLVFLGEHCREPHPFPRLIQASVICDSLFLPDLKRVAIPRRLSSFGLHQFSSCQTSKVQVTYISLNLMCEWMGRTGVESSF